MTCPAFTGGGPSIVAEALRTVDCQAGEATAAAFSRLFGGEGVLTVALSLVLTIYVALFALRLLTGQSRLGISALTPRMMGLGLALTFATSWVAYSSVIWTLLASGPDWIAASLLGIKGSAAHAFAERLDLLFAAVADAAEQAQKAAGDAKGTTPGDLLAYAALLLLLGTVGVLVTSRIALAVLLALGPIFLILALFRGTRGLFEGWVKTAVMFALAPMFATLIGVGSVAMLNPVVASLQGGEVGLEQAAAVFVAAAIHCMLMVVALKLVGALTSGWRIGLGDNNHRDAPDQPPQLFPDQRANMPNQALPLQRLAVGPQQIDSRVREVASAVSVKSAESAPEPSRSVIHLPGATVHGVSLAPSIRPAGGDRSRELVRSFRPAHTSASRKEILP